MTLKDMPRITAAVTLAQNDVTHMYTAHTKSADTGKHRLFNTQRQIDSKRCSEFDDPKTSTSGILLKK